MSNRNEKLIDWLTGIVYSLFLENEKSIKQEASLINIEQIDKPKVTKARQKLLFQLEKLAIQESDDSLNSQFEQNIQDNKHKQFYQQQQDKGFQKQKLKSYQSWVDYLIHSADQQILKVKINEIKLNNNESSKLQINHNIEVLPKIETNQNQRQQNKNCRIYCKLCYKRFIKLKYIRKHYSYKHNLIIDFKSTNINQKIDCKDIFCLYCHSTFESWYQLREHFHTDCRKLM